MGIIEELLGGYQGQTNALMSAATGGMQAPAETAAASAGPAPGPQKDPLAVLLEGAMRWQKRHGKDPLQENIGGVRFDGRRHQQTPSPVRMLTDPGARGLAAGGTVMTRGKHAGQAAQRYDLGDGRMAHVYYDEKGRRQVEVFARPPGSSASR